MHSLEVTYDEGVFRSKFGSPLGISLLILRVLIGGVFLYSVCHTIYKYGSKRAFYRKFLLFGVTWIWTFPLIFTICGIVLVADEQTDGTASIYVEGVVLLFNLVPMLAIQFGMLLMYDTTCKFNKKFPFHAKVKEMKKLKTARVKIVGGGGDVEEGAPLVERYVNLTEKQISLLHTKLDTASYRLERVNEAVGYLQTELDDLEAVGYADDSTMDDVPDADAYVKPKEKKLRRRRGRGDGDEDSQGSGDEEEGRRGRRRRRRNRGDDDEDNDRGDDNDQRSDENEDGESSGRKRRPRRQRRPRGEQQEK